MHEKSKLREAHHFLARMNAEHGNPAAFKHELSAFIGSARSVLQYTLKEAKDRPGSLAWYEQAVNNPLVRYFKEKRDSNIHEAPVEPTRSFRTETAALLNIGDDDDVIMIPYPHFTSVERYEFPDRPGEEVTELARQYLTALEQLVEDGMRREFITG